MAVRRHFTNPDNDLGRWHDWKKDPDNGKMIRARIRDIPAGVESKIRNAHRAENMRVEVDRRSESGSINVDLDRNRKIARDRAAFALLETENYNVAIGDKEAADEYAKLGEGLVVEVGAELSLDDKWVNARLKAHELTANTEFTGWVITCVDGEASELRERNAELEGNS